MAGPLVVLAVPTILLGVLIGWPPEGGLLHQWLEPVFAGSEKVLGHEQEAYQLLGIDGFLVGASVAVAVLGVIFAMRLFGFRIPLFGAEVQPRPATVERWTDRLRPLYRGSSHKWWFDDLNDLLFVRIGGVVARSLWWFDVHVIDGTVNGLGAITATSGREIRRIQTGRVQNYALGIALGLLVMAGSYLLIVGR
jgi:NADH-quinone oxidoreductase subunit L